MVEKNQENLEEAPLGLYAVVPSPSGEHANLKDFSKLKTENDKQIIQPGVIYCLRHKGNTEGNETVNPINPYYLVYVYDNGTVKFNYASSKHILEVFKILALGEEQPYDELCDIFNRETNNGSDMQKYSELMNGAVNSVVSTFGKKIVNALTSSRSAIIPNSNKQTKHANDFELITWLIIK